MNTQTPSPRDELSGTALRRLISTRLIALLALLAIALGGAALARGADHGFGAIDVQEIRIMTAQGVPMTAKVYRPAWVTPENPAPGILALHGYQSDKDATTLFGTVELARRGFVVLAFDHFGHGDSTGWGVDGPILSGAENAYQALVSLPFVDADHIGLFGHSTGSVFALSLAEAHPDVQAIVALSGNGGNPIIPELSNYLLVQGFAEEIPPYREGTWPVLGLDTNENRLAAFEREGEGVVEWNVTYGDFADGSARRAELVHATHLGVMIASESNAAVVDWFGQAFAGELDESRWIEPGDQVYFWKEIGGAITLFALLGTLVPLLDLLLQWRLLRPGIIGEGTWRGPRARGRAVLAVVSIAMTMVLYPIFTQWGGGTDPIATAIPFLPLEMGNGVIAWIAVSAAVTALLYLVWRKAGGGRGESARSLGIVAAEGKAWHGIVAGLGITAGLVAWLVLITALLRWSGFGEVRMIWPFFRGLTTERALYLLPYFLVIAAFFFVVNGLFASVQARIPSDGRSDVRLWLVRTGYSLAALVGGLVILLLIQFVPALTTSSPGMDLLGLSQFSGRWSMMLWVIIPQFVILIVVTTWAQVRSRSIWVGTMLGASLFTWIMVGSQVGRF